MINITDNNIDIKIQIDKNFVHVLMSISHLFNQTPEKYIQQLVNQELLRIDEELHAILVYE